MSHFDVFCRLLRITYLFIDIKIFEFLKTDIIFNFRVIRLVNRVVDIVLKVDFIALIIILNQATVFDIHT